MRLENLVGAGMPDVNGCLNGTESWIETKLVKGNRIRFEPFQPAWLQKRARAGGRVFVFARKGATFYVWAGWPRAWTDRCTLLSDGGISVDYRDAAPVLTMHMPYPWSLLIEVLFTRPINHGNPC